MCPAIRIRAQPGPVGTSRQEPIRRIRSPSDRGAHSKLPLERWLTVRWLSFYPEAEQPGGAGCLHGNLLPLARGNYFPGICSRSRSVYRPNSDRRSRMIPSGTKRGWRCVHANERKIWDELRTWDQARSVRIESLSVCSRLLCRRAAKWLVIFSASVCLIVSVVFRL